MVDPIPYWRSDPDYYSKNHPDRPSHIQRIKQNLRIDKLISMASNDGSYSITVRK